MRRCAWNWQATDASRRTWRRCGSITRVSYSERYLPNIYHDPADADAASFLERMLANMEGFYSETEGKMRDVSMLFDARSAPGDTLDWLAGWYGLLVDPLWADIQSRRVAGTRGTVADRPQLWVNATGWASYSPAFPPAAVVHPLRGELYQRRGTLDGIRFALLLLLDPCLEILLERFKQAALNPAHPLHRDLDRLGMPHPTPVTGEQAVEDMLYDYVLAQPSQVRLIERFMTRWRSRVGGRRSDRHNSDRPADIPARRAPLLGARAAEYVARRRGDGQPHHQSGEASPH